MDQLFPVALPVEDTSLAIGDQVMFTWASRWILTPMGLICLSMELVNQEVIPDQLAPLPPELSGLDDEMGGNDDETEGS